jgi:hypothetical protein
MGLETHFIKGTFSKIVSENGERLKELCFSDPYSSIKLKGSLLTEMDICPTCFAKILNDRKGD